MSAPDEVLLDALREAGYGRVTVWHLRALEAWLAQVEVTGVPKRGYDYDTPAEMVEIRLRSDLYDGPLDRLHGAAEWENAHRHARRSARLPPPTDENRRFEVDP